MTVNSCVVYVLLALPCLFACGRTELDFDQWEAPCDAACQTCGNLSLETVEQCDDGNRINGDGCSARCQWEPVSITCGDIHTCAIGANGRLLCWGANPQGQLGQGDTEHRGDDPNELGRALLPVDIGGNALVAAAAGRTSTCAITSEARLKCWGENVFGQLGLGDTNNRGDEPNEMGEALPTLDLGIGAQVWSVAVDRAVACVLLSNGTAKCWGTSYQGQLGMGATREVGTQPNQMGDRLAPLDLGSGRTIRYLAMSRRGGFACAILDNDALKCWGQNTSGALGLEDVEDRGDERGEMGDRLPAVSLGAGQLPIALALGGGHSCALLQEGRVKCWGGNADGSLGLGDTIPRGLTPGTMGDALPFVNLGAGRRVVALAASFASTCAIMDDGDVKCWGSNYGGELGLGDREHRGTSPSDMGENLPTVNLGTGRSAKSICAGSGHLCALLDNGTIKCWGNNSVGQLGIGTDGFDASGRPGPATSIGDAQSEIGDNLAAVDLVF